MIAPPRVNGERADALASGAGVAVVVALTRANGPGHLSPRLSLNAVCQVTRSGRAAAIAAAAHPLASFEHINTLTGAFPSCRQPAWLWSHRCRQRHLGLTVRLTLREAWHDIGANNF